MITKNSLDFDLLDRAFALQEKIYLNKELSNFF